jgi:hypothetical protein
MVLKTLLIFGFSLTPWLISLWVIRKAEIQAHQRLRFAQLGVESITILNECRHSQERYYVEGVGYLIGDRTCKFNAQSVYIRRTVNPLGLCKDCIYL